MSVTPVPSEPGRVVRMEAPALHYEVVFSTERIAPASFPSFPYMLSAVLAGSVEFTAVITGKPTDIDAIIKAHWPDAGVMTMKQVLDPMNSFKARSILVSPMGTLPPPPPPPPLTFGQRFLGFKAPKPKD